MGKTSIAWCDYTFNIWWGCFKISPGCKNCYAATFDRRVHGKDTEFWDAAGPRRFFGDEYWAKPIAWNAKAARDGVRYRVFVGSMCDWAEKHPDAETDRVMAAFRIRLFDLIRRTPHLDWLLLSKRIENVKALLPWTDADKPWPNVWVMTTVEDQEHADRRVPILLEINAVVRGLSCEPLLGPIDLRRIGQFRGEPLSALEEVVGYIERRKIDWVIAGAESGPRARPCNLEWLRFLRDQCREAGTRFLLKQAHETWNLDTENPTITANIGSHRKGKTLIEMPYLDGHQHLEFPGVAR